MITTVCRSLLTPRQAFQVTRHRRSRPRSSRRAIFLLCNFLGKISTGSASRAMFLLRILDSSVQTICKWLSLVSTCLGPNRHTAFVRPISSALLVLKSTTKQRNCSYVHVLAAALNQLTCSVTCVFSQKPPRSRRHHPAICQHVNGSHDRRIPQRPSRPQTMVQLGNIRWIVPLPHTSPPI